MIKNSEGIGYRIILSRILRLMIDSISYSVCKCSMLEVLVAHCISPFLLPYVVPKRDDTRSAVPETDFLFVT